MPPSPCPQGVSTSSEHHVFPKWNALGLAGRALRAGIAGRFAGLVAMVCPASVLPAGVLRCHAGISPANFELIDYIQSAPALTVVVRRSVPVVKSFDVIPISSNDSCRNHDSYAAMPPPPFASSTMLVANRREPTLPRSICIMNNMGSFRSLQS